MLNHTFFSASMTEEEKHFAALEATWSYHITQENQSYRSSDCVSKLMKGPFGLTKFSLGRTKCEAIVRSVLAPLFTDMIQEELSTVRFVAIATDASNHGAIKMYPVLVRYFLPEEGVKVC